jgi:hypothetical protein
MLLIALLIIAIVGIAVAMVFFGNIRRTLLNQIRIIGYNIGTLWNNIPRLGSAMHPIVWVLVIILLLILLIWLVPFVAIVVVGTSMGSTWNGMWLGFLVVTSAIFCIIKGIPGFKIVGTITFCILLLVLLFSSIDFISNGSWSRLTEDLRQELSDRMNNLSIKTEGKSGEVGRIDADGIVGYNVKKNKDNFDASKLCPIPRGTKVLKVTVINGGKVTEASESMVWIMLPNQFGDFVSGKLLMIPSRKVNWNFAAEDAAKAEAEAAAKAKTEADERSKVAAAEAKAKTEANPPASVASAPAPQVQVQAEPTKPVISFADYTRKSWQFYWKKPAGVSGNSSVRSKKLNARITEMDADNLTIDVRTPQGDLYLFEGKRNGNDLSYFGSWHQVGGSRNGKFHFNFKGMLAEGEHSDTGGQGIPTWLSAT